MRAVRGLLAGSIGGLGPAREDLGEFVADFGQARSGECGGLIIDEGDVSVADGGDIERGDCAEPVLQRGGGKVAVKLAIWADSPARPMELLPSASRIRTNKPSAA